MASGRSDPRHRRGGDRELGADAWRHGDRRQLQGTRRHRVQRAALSPARGDGGASGPGHSRCARLYKHSRNPEPFAIEFARRGYVVLALDQLGQGYSEGGATTKGFGGPEGLDYLRRLPFVDRRNIGLEGHSMGGWAVLAAAAAMPGDYAAMVLEGSSVGAPFARDGTPAWPRNVAVVFSRFDEFAPLMWSVRRAADVGKSVKLRALFGAMGNVAADRIYGSIAAGTARLLRTPTATHPGDHLSTVAVADAADWFSRTLVGGQARDASDQIWWVKEAGTGLALLGLAALVFGTFDLLVGLTKLKTRAIAVDAATAVLGHRGTLWLLTAFIPAVTYYCALLVLPPPVAVFAMFPQAITNWLMVWAIGNAAVALGLAKLLHQAPAADFAPMPAVLPSLAGRRGDRGGLLRCLRSSGLECRFSLLARCLETPLAAATTLVLHLCRPVHHLHRRHVSGVEEDPRTGSRVYLPLRVGRRRAFARLPGAYGRPVRSAVRHRHPAPAVRGIERDRCDLVRPLTCGSGVPCSLLRAAYGEFFSRSIDRWAVRNLVRRRRNRDTLHAMICSE